MTPEIQRILIAETCGWYRIAFDRGWKRAGDGEVNAVIPDYLNDLNAMHEAEKLLTEPEQVIDYMEWLGMCDDDYGFKVWRYVHATAAQRAEAFLKTKGLWK